MATIAFDTVSKNIILTNGNKVSSVSPFLVEVTYDSPTTTYTFDFGLNVGSFDFTQVEVDASPSLESSLIAIQKRDFNFDINVLTSNFENIDIKMDGYGNVYGGDTITTNATTIQYMDASTQAVGVAADTTILYCDTRNVSGGPVTTTLKEPNGNKKLSIYLRDFPDSNILTLSSTAANEFDFGLPSVIVYRGTDVWAVYDLTYDAINETWLTGYAQ